MVYVNAQYLSYTATLCGDVKRASYEMAGITQSQGRRLDVLDVGCGIGVDTTKIAQQVSADSRIVGVDADAEMVARANEKARSLGLKNVQHFHRDGTQLDFKDEFDVVRAERVFQHLREPSRVLGNMVAAARKGGMVILIDTDWSTLKCSVFDEEENRAMAEAYSRRLTFGVNLAVLRRLFEEQGLSEVQFQTIGVRLDRNDYMTASKFTELAREAFDASTRQKLGAKLEMAPPHDNFGAIDIVLIAGRK